MAKSKQPFSAPRPRSLPTSTGTQDINQTLASWQTALNPGIKSTPPQPTPYNFSVTNSRGGLQLSWSPVSGADGYEILKSQNGSFTDDLQVISIKDANRSNHFDSTGGNAQGASYRIRTTSGTPQNPQAQRGPESGVVKHTSIDAGDTNSVPTTLFDNYTTDKTRSTARLGNYGAIRQSTLGKVGGILAGSGARGGSGSNSGVPAVGTTSFASIGTSTNSNATLSVGAGAQIIPDSTSPGVIAATNIQTVPVSTTLPTNGQILQYSASSGLLAFVSIIGTGTQAALPAALPLALGQIYVASDTGNLFIGTPGIGIGYLQVGDTAQMNETLLKLLLEIRAMRLALTTLVCEGGLAAPTDFDPQMLASDTELTTQQN